MRKIRIKVVDDQACPVCGAIAGHPLERLNFQNRPKVCDEKGVWWWRCYNPDCICDYYDPNSGRWETKPTPEEEAEIIKRAKEKVDRLFAEGKITIHHVGGRIEEL